MISVIDIWISILIIWSVDCSGHCWGLEWSFWPIFFAKCIFHMYHEAAKKIGQIFQFYPLRELSFCRGSLTSSLSKLRFNRQLHTKASPELRFNRQSISDLQTHIGGHHPILYFKSQITKKHRHRRNVTSYHFFSLLWLFQLHWISTQT